MLDDVSPRPVLVATNVEAAEFRMPFGVRSVVRPTVSCTLKSNPEAVLFAQHHPMPVKPGAPTTWSVVGVALATWPWAAATMTFTPATGPRRWSKSLKHLTLIVVLAPSDAVKT